MSFLLERNQILISLIVSLESEYLYEIERIQQPAHEIITDLANRINLRVCKWECNAIFSQWKNVSGRGILPIA
jgi:hypothetical protein